MKKVITILVVLMFLMSGIAVSCSKKKTNEEMKQKIETNAANKKTIKKNFAVPVIKKQINIKKLRKALKTKADKEIGEKEVKVEKEIKAEEKVKVEEKVKAEEKVKVEEK